MNSQAASIHPAQSDAWAWSEETHEKNMRQAIRAGAVAGKAGRPPVGAVIVDLHCRVVANGYDLTGPCCDPTAHAETTAIRSAALSAGRLHLPDLVLYVTMEPCSMCLSACAAASLGGIVFGACHGLLEEPGCDRDGYDAAGRADGLQRAIDGSSLFVRGGVGVEEALALLRE